MGNQECSGAKIKVIFSAWFFPFSADCYKMARGHQKIQSQQRNAKKQAEQKKAKGHDQKTAAKAALVFTCSVCRVSMGLIQEQKGISISCGNSVASDKYEMFCCLDKSCVLTHLGDISPSFLQSQMPDPKTFKQHFESKHPKSPLPPELEGVEA